MTAAATLPPAAPSGARRARLRNEPVRPGNLLSDFYAAQLLRDALCFFCDLDSRQDFTGSVCFFAGDPFRWSADLPDSASVHPRVLLVVHSGHVYRADGGNDMTGALKWELIFTPETEGKK